MKHLTRRRVARWPAALTAMLACLASYGANTKYSATAEERHDAMLLYFEDPKDDLTIPRGIEQWWGYRYMLGNGFYRDQLADNGLTLSLKFVTDSLGNVTGGRDQGFTYTGSLGFDANADLTKLAGIPGADFYVSAVWRSGTSLSNKFIGNVFQTQQVYGGQNLRLYAFYWRQQLWQEQLEVKIGRIAQGDDFLSRPIYWSYVQNAFDGNPVSIFLNAPMYAYPNSTWGSMFKYTPKDHDFYVEAGVYGGAKDPPQNRNSAHGLDWSFDYENAFFIGQAGWTPELTIGEHRDLPGHYSMGAYYVTEEHTRFLQPPPVGGAPPFTNEATGLWGLYWMVDQMVFSNGVDSHGDKTGVTPWFVVSIAPDETVNTMPFSFYGGIRWDAILPSRPDDFLGLGFVYGEFSDDLATSQRLAGAPAQDFEAVLELTYKIQLNPWLTFQPDLQYIFNPGGAGNFDDALVLGFQASVQF